VKTYIRTIGIDDAAFNRDKSSKTFVFGVVVRGYTLIEGILRTEVEVDGLDATDRISDMITKSQFKDQLRAIFLASSTIAAFNIINMHKLYINTGIPVVTILSREPDKAQVQKALNHLSDSQKRLEILQSNPPIQKLKYTNKNGKTFEKKVQWIGFKETTEVVEIIQKTTFTSAFPESLRIADLIGQSFKDYLVV